ncbi:MAG: O-antigen ligase family protein [Patescibacteria group bacterium]
MQKLISALFTLLLILVPVVFYPYSSEVFEFNKLIVVYTFTVLICGTWIARMITEKRFIFKKTFLDIPLILFLGSQVISSVSSIDPHTSIFGYYSRFNGGLLSIVCYLLVYWAFVSNVNKAKILQLLKAFSIVVLFVSLWAILEHFGKSVSCIIIRNEFNTDCWVQDVQSRVFASMGQPNWLAALLVAATPLPIYFSTQAKSLVSKFGWQAISVVYLLALIYTKSRSGLLAFGITVGIVFFGFLLNSAITSTFKKTILGIVINIVLFIVVLASVGSIWTPSVGNYNKQIVPTGPALETGGTESADIRKIVWKGAIKLWKKYPLTGSGVETFGFSYYETRPTEHNLVSEWDFIYNKAHNEYLNFLATTGVIGLGTYLLVICFSLIQFLIYWMKSLKTKDVSFLIVCLGAGYVSILATNFFGFSVVATSLVFFLLPGFAVGLLNASKDSEEETFLEGGQKIALGVVSLVCVYILYLIITYWRADYFYSQSKISEQDKDYPQAVESIKTAISLSSNEAVYHDQYARLLADYAVAYQELKEQDTAIKFAQTAESEALLAKDLSVRNVNLQRSRANIYTDLAVVDRKYLQWAVATLEEVKDYSPTDAKAYYKLGLAHLRINDVKSAIESFKQAVELKPNYLDARLALGLTLIDDQKLQEAKKELQFILDNLDPNNKLAKEELSKL